jgi:hypothetical protein
MMMHFRPHHQKTERGSVCEMPRFPFIRLLFFFIDLSSYSASSDGLMIVGPPLGSRKTPKKIKVLPKSFVFERKTDEVQIESSWVRFSFSMWRGCPSLAVAWLGTGYHLSAGTAETMSSVKNNY